MRALQKPPLFAEPSKIINQLEITPGGRYSRMLNDPIPIVDGAQEVGILEGVSSDAAFG